MPISVRARADTMPCVTVWPTPKGSPMANARSPTSMASESPSSTTGKVLLIPFDAQHGEIAARIAEQNLRREFAPVRQHHFHIGHVLDDVMIGHDEARRINNHAGAKRLRGRAARPLSAAEKALKNGIVVNRVARLTVHPLRVDIDHRRRGLFHQRRKAQVHFRFRLRKGAGRLGPDGRAQQERQDGEAVRVKKMGGMRLPVPD